MAASKPVPAMMMNRGCARCRPRPSRDLAHVHLGGAACAAGGGERGGLGRVADVVEEEVGGAGGEDQHGHAGVAQAVEHVGDAAVAAGDHHAVEGRGVRGRVLRLHAVPEEPHDDLVACRERTWANAKISSELGPDARLWMMRQRMRCSLFLRKAEYSYSVVILPPRAELQTIYG